MAPSERNLASPQTILSAFEGIVHKALNPLTTRTNYTNYGEVGVTVPLMYWFSLAPLLKGILRGRCTCIYSDVGKGFLQFTRNMFDLNISLSMENRAYPYQHMEHPFVSPLYSVYSGYDIYILYSLVYVCNTFLQQNPP